MELLAVAAAAAGNILSIAAMLTMLVKPLRERLFADRKVTEGHKCLLRAEIVGIYYKHVETESLRQYEYENLCYCYRAYQALGGNSFIDHIFAEMQEWSIQA